METKITKIDSLLNLTIKSSGRGQNQLSALNSDDNAFPVGINRKFSSDDSGVKQQNSGFEGHSKRK